MMEIRARWEDHKYACGYDHSKPSVLGFLYHEGEQLVRELVCKVNGHKWIDDSYAGPESGSMDMYCERCGLDFHQILY